MNIIFYTPDGLSNKGFYSLNIINEFIDGTLTSHYGYIYLGNILINRNSEDTIDHFDVVPSRFKIKKIRIK